MTKFWLGDEIFVRRKILTDKVLSDNVLLSGKKYHCGKPADAIHHILVTCVVNKYTWER